MKKNDSEKLYTETDLKDAIHDNLTVMLLRLRDEIFRGGGMDKDGFTQSHFPHGFDDYERKIAKREGIKLI